jgi:methylthioribulose 1-phosphate dehydratase/enolase-phosphatase E1
LSPLSHQAGDLRPYLCGFFDTTSGPKTEPRSYKEIALHLGVDDPAQLLFATDILGEAQAAAAAGWEAVLVVRPGNKALPEGHGFRTVEAITQLLEA